MDCIFFDADYELGLDIDFESFNTCQIPSLTSNEEFKPLTPTSPLNSHVEKAKGTSPSDQFAEVQHPTIDGDGSEVDLDNIDLDHPRDGSEFDFNNIDLDDPRWFDYISTDEPIYAQENLAEIPTDISTDEPLHAQEDLAEIPTDMVSTVAGYPLPDIPLLNIPEETRPAIYIPVVDTMTHQPTISNDDGLFSGRNQLVNLSEPLVVTNGVEDMHKKRPHPHVIVGHEIREHRSSIVFPDMVVDQSLKGMDNHCEHRSSIIFPVTDMVVDQSLKGMDNHCEHRSSIIFPMTGLVVNQNLKGMDNYFSSDCQIISPSKRSKLSNGAPIQQQYFSGSTPQLKNVTDQNNFANNKRVDNNLFNQHFNGTNISFAKRNQSVYQPYTRFRDGNVSAIVDQQYPHSTIHQVKRQMGMESSTTNLSVANSTADRIVNQPKPGSAINVEAVQYQQNSSSPAQVEHHLNNGKKTKASSLEFHHLSKLFYLSMEDAAKMLNLGSTSLKARCRKVGIDRWPHRKLDSLNKLILYFQDAINRNGGDMVMKNELARLMEQKRAIERNPNMELTPQTIKLRQAYFKAKFNSKCLSSRVGE